MFNYRFFYGGTFSQWAKNLKFHEGGYVYVTAEQYMMAGKARLFQDEETLKKIMATNDPFQQKKLGREVTPFYVQTWNAKARDIVYRGNFLKFTQNPDALKELLETKGSQLVEASPTDRLWGIGLGMDSPDLENVAKWQGTNWLGEVLTKLRQDILLGKTQFENHDWKVAAHEYTSPPPL